MLAGATAIGVWVGVSGHAAAPLDCAQLPPVGLTRSGQGAEPAADPSQWFLTVTISYALVKGGGNPHCYLVHTLDLRSVRSGLVIAPLLHDQSPVDAVLTKSGAVIAVVDRGCQSQVLSIDPGTGEVTPIRVLPQSATGAALSPDGRQLAYLTYPASSYRIDCRAAPQDEADRGHRSCRSTRRASGLLPQRRRHRQSRYWRHGPHSDRQSH